MALLSSEERSFAEAIGRLSITNPFLHERIQQEEQALGPAFVAAREVWSADADLDGLNPNLKLLDDRVNALVPRLRQRLGEGVRAEPRDLELYDGLVIYHLYSRYEREWRALIDDAGAAPPRRVPCYRRFAEDVAHLYRIPGVEIPGRHDAPFLFAYGFQLRRAFHHVFRQLFGTSLPAARLRACVWQSIFTHDGARYRRALWDRMQEIPTLVTGASGTGKELVARAIGLSRFVPFDPESGTFAEDPATSFHPLNLSALSPTLIESELFGHRRGAFTGALEDRAGWLETCSSLGTVFLDEIGELDGAIQVKLLRVLQARTIQRLGETRTRRFEGKIIAATNRDLSLEMREGRFRQDLFYRLCADQIHAPSLHEQLQDRPEDLGELVRVLARRQVGEEEAESLAAEVEAWIDGELGRDHAWPGNVRELEQCVRNVLVRREYRPAAVGVGKAAAAGPAERLGAEVAAGALAADELLSRYCTLVYHATGSYEEAARRLGIDRRTVKAKLDPEFLERLSAS